MLTMDPRPRSRMRLAISRETRKLPAACGVGCVENLSAPVSRQNWSRAMPAEVDEAGDRANSASRRSITCTTAASSAMSSCTKRTCSPEGLSVSPALGEAALAVAVHGHGAPAIREHGLDDGETDARAAPVSEYGFPAVDVAFLRCPGRLSSRADGSTSRSRGGILSPRAPPRSSSPVIAP